MTQNHDNSQLLKLDWVPTDYHFFPAIFSFISLVIYPANNGTFHFQPTSEEDVITILKRLKRNKVGAFGMNSNVYKDLSQAISNEDSLLINGCFRESIFPICAKKAHVLPIPKVKNSLKLEDYRPISIQTTLSKILEMAMLQQIENFVQQNNVISTQQFGFRPGKSTEDLLQKLNTKIRLNLNAGYLSILILLDFSKAFDTLSHEKLISKLLKVGFGIAATKLLINYLRNR